MFGGYCIPRITEKEKKNILSIVNWCVLNNTAHPEIWDFFSYCLLVHIVSMPWGGCLRTRKCIRMRRHFLVRKHPPHGINIVIRKMNSLLHSWWILIHKVSSYILVIQTHWLMRPICFYVLCDILDLDFFRQMAYLPYIHDKWNPSAKYIIVYS